MNYDGAPAHSGVVHCPDNPDISPLDYLKKLIILCRKPCRVFHERRRIFTILFIGHKLDYILQTATKIVKKYLFYLK